MKRSRSPARLAAARLLPAAPAALAVLACACGGAPAADNPAPSSPIDRGALRAGFVYHGALAEGAVDRYRVDLTAGDAVLLEVAQDAVDLLVRVAGPGDREPLVFDFPPLTMAPERVCRVAADGGTFTLDVAPYSGAGTYSLRILHQRPATEADRHCHRAAETYASSGGAAGLGERLERAEEAGRLWEAAGETLLAAVAWRDAGQLRLDQGESGRGIAGLERARALARESGYARLETSILNRLGLAYRDGGDLPRAADTLDRALALARAGDDLRGTASALTNRGRVDEAMGEPHRAIDRYREALELWRREDDPGETAQTLDNLGDVLGVIDHHDEALEALDEALRLTRAARDTEREATVLSSIGWIHHLRGEPGRGLGPLREARALRRANRDAKGEAGELDRLGTLLRAAGDPRAAEEAYRQSLAISERMDLPSYNPATWTNLGCLLAESGRGREAADYLARAVDYFEGSDDPMSWSHTEYCLALLAHRRGDLESALVHVRRALGVVEDLRVRARAAGHHYPPIWLWQDYAEFELALLFERHRADGDPRALAEAFAAADRTRARTLYELVVLTRGGAERAAGRVLEREAERLQARLSALGAERSARLADGAAPGSIAELDAEIRRLRLALQFARAEMREAARAAGELGMPRAVSAAEAQRLLDRRTVLLTYILGEERSHLLVLTRDRLEAFELPARRVIEAHAEGLYEALRKSRRADGQWLLAAGALGRMLLPRAAIPPGVERLMVAPEGILHYVPFAVLASPLASPREAAAGRLVVDDFDVVTVPSAAVLAALRARREARPPAPKTLAVFADPIFSADDPRVGEPASSRAEPGEAAAGDPEPARVERAIVPDRLPSGPLPPLPATADEAAAILARVPPGESLARLGPDATKLEVLSADLSPYRILHFATHAWIDEDFPELSGLVLSTVDRAGRPIDGALYLHEIDRLDLAADLTVLSGCQTALGRRVPGDGLLGLTQGFFQAGSSQVLVSLWSLDDVGAARLMDELYGRMLDRGERPAAALRHAQRWLRAQDGFAAPRYWAPFVLQGDG